MRRQPMLPHGAQALLWQLPFNGALQHCCQIQSQTAAFQATTHLQWSASYQQYPHCEQHCSGSRQTLSPTFPFSQYFTFEGGGVLPSVQQGPPTQLAALREVVVA